MTSIDSTGVKIDIALAALIKALYPTYSNYLESLQASGNLKSLTFDTLADKIAEREKAFGKKNCEPTSDTLCILKRERMLLMILLRVKVATMVMVGGITKVGGQL